MTSSTKKRIAQLRQGQVPEGYRLTRLGIVPSDWLMFRIGDCLERVERPVEVQADKLYTQIGIRSHGKGLFYKEEVTGAELGNKAVFWIEPNCFILNIVFAWEQAIGKTTQAEEGMIGSHRFPMYRPINSRVDIDYLINYFLTKRGTEILEAASPGGAGRNKTLGQDRFLKSKVVLPPLAEQRKIAKMLAAQDKVIELLNRKIEHLKLLKKYYLRKMFPQHGKNEPEVRFPGFAGAWEKHQLGKIFKKNVERNEGLIGFDKTISIASMTYNREGNGASEDSLSGYKVLRHGDVAFDGHTNKEFHYGRFVVNDLGDGIMSSRFSSLRPIDDIQIRFWKHYIHYEPIMGRLLVKATKAGTMMNELVVPEFLHQYLLLPSHAEQKKIGKFFDDLDAKIALLRRQHDEEVRKKKALMQLLLTGIVRVRGVESGVAKRLPADRNLLANGKQIRKERAKCRRTYQ